MNFLITPLFLRQQLKPPAEVKSWLYRAIITFVSALWFSFLPMYFTLLYMAERKFFSYEFLSEDAFGMRTLIISGVVFLFVISLYLFGFLAIFRLAILEGRKAGKYDSNRWLVWVTFLVSVFMHLLLFYSSLSAAQPNLYFGISAFAFIVCAYLSSFIGGSLRERLSTWLPTAMFIGITAFLPFFHRETTADLIEIALRQFRVGGGIPVKVIKWESHESFIKGNLLLRTPKNLYITVSINRKSALVIVRNSDNIRIEVDSN